MQTNTNINMFNIPNNWRYIQMNNTPRPDTSKNYLNGLQNARNILTGLEQSLQKTRKYEKQLLRCKTTHAHSHGINEWWDTDQSEGKDCKNYQTDAIKTARNQVDVAESWSTMSIVCLQYQYEELSKRYESLLQAYDDRCNTLNARDATLTQLRERAKKAHEQLSRTHKALLRVGDKYLALRRKGQVERSIYEDKISRLKSTVHGVIAAAQEARRELDCQLEMSMAEENDGAAAILLAEIRKCNLLCLENLRLKAQIEELNPGTVAW